MARVTYVKKAQQRYVQVPVIDPVTREQKQTPVLRRDGTQKTTKHGRPVFMRVTVDDKTKPLPNLTCEVCGKEIEPGSPYKHVTPKSGPYGGRKRVRCAACPTWRQWDLSQSLSARVAQIEHDFRQAIEGVETKEDVESALNDAAEAIREIAEEKREGAQNIEDGFGHPTSMSEELTDVADQLDSWADDVEGADVPDLPEPEGEDCDECAGSGTIERFFVVNAEDRSQVFEDDEEGSGTEAKAVAEIERYVAEWNAKPGNQGNQVSVDQFDAEARDVECEECGGSGKQDEPDEPTEDQMDEWRSEVEDAVSVIDDCPV